MDKPLAVNHAPNRCPSCFVNILFVLNKTCITNSHLGSEPFITVRQWKLIWLHPYFLTKSYLTLVLEFLCADMPVCVQGKWYSCKSMANMVSKWGREREALGQLLRLHGERSIDESCPGKDEMCICPSSNMDLFLLFGALQQSWALSFWHSLYLWAMPITDIWP